jgi:uncharacterized damage-inducible protein DinB
MTLQDYLRAFEDQIKPTETLFRSIPSDKLDWKPTESSFSLGQQIAHIAIALEVYGRGIASADWGFTTMRERFLMNRHTPSATVDEAVRLLHEKFGLFKSIVGALTEEEFNAGEVDAPQFGGKTPRWRVAMLALEHHITHKAELFMCLKLLEVRVHTGHLYRG